MKPGDIYFIQFEPSVGFEIQKSRPGLIIQKAPYRNTVIVIPISSKPMTNNRFEFALRKDAYNRLYKDSVVVLDQVKSFDLSRFIGKIGEVHRTQLEQILLKFDDLLFSSYFF
jgi:mRNA interferase MazF